MKNKFLLILFLLALLKVQAQIATIVDAETTLPLETVTLTCSNSEATAITNISGQADISLFQDTENIEIRLIGYKPLIVSYKYLKESDFIIKLETSRLNIDEVIISATKWNQKSSESALRVTTLKPKTVAIQNPQTAADMLGITGNVFIQKSQQGGGSPMIRGFATNRLLYTVDEVRMNTAIFRSGNIQNVISLDPFSIENTEVLFGPGSVIYGSDAIGGVMSFQTLSPQFSQDKNTYIKGKAVTRYTTANNEKTFHFDVNMGWKKWALLTSVTTSEYGDLKMGSHGPDDYLKPYNVQRQDSVDVILTNNNPQVQSPSGYSQINLMQKVSYRPNENWELKYGFHYSETSAYSRYDRHLRYKNGLPRYGEWNYGPQKWMMNNVNILQSKGNILYDQMAANIAYQYFEESRISRNLNKPDRETRVEKVDAYSINFDFNKSLGISKFYYGFEAVKNNVTSIGRDENILTGIIKEGSTRYPQSYWVSHAIYLSDQLNVTDRITLLSGIRYNQFAIDADFDTTFYPFPFTTASLNNSAVTGNFGIVFRPSDTWNIRVNGATAFRSPNIDDMGKVFDSGDGKVTIPNPDLKAEYAYSGDLGIAKVFDESFKVDFSLYYTLLKNALVRRDFTLNGLDSIVYDGLMSKVQAVQNAAEAHVFGLQAGIELKLLSGLGFSSVINYQKGKEELDNGNTSPSRHAPPWFGNSALSYTTGNLYIEVYVVYSGEKKYEDMPEEEIDKPEIYAKDKSDNPYSPGWYTLNFKASYMLTENFTINAGVENLTDQRYRPYSSGIAAAGRNFIFSINANF